MQMFPALDFFYMLGRLAWSTAVVIVLRVSLLARIDNVTSFSVRRSKDWVFSPVTVVSLWRSICLNYTCSPFNDLETLLISVLSWTWSRLCKIPRSYLFVRNTVQPGLSLWCTTLPCSACLLWARMRLWTADECFSSVLSLTICRTLRFWRFCRQGMDFFDVIAKNEIRLHFSSWTECPIHTTDVSFLKDYRWSRPLWACVRKCSVPIYLFNLVSLFPFARDSVTACSSGGIRAQNCHQTSGFSSLLHPCLQRLADTSIYLQLNENQCFNLDQLLAFNQLKKADWSQVSFVFLLSYNVSSGVVNRVDSCEVQESTRFQWWNAAVKDHSETLSDLAKWAVLPLWGRWGRSRGGGSISK